MSTELTGNLAKEILGRAARHGERMAVRTESDFVSYDALRELVINYALQMRAGGIGRSSCVAIDTDHPIIATILPLACSLLGCAWVHDTPMVAWNRALGVTHRVHDATNPPAQGRNNLRITRDWSGAPTGLSRPDLLAFPGYADPQRTWMIAQSSGTTGEAKFMAYSEDHCLRYVNRGLTFSVREGGKFTSLFHPLSTPGLLPKLRTLVDGGTFCVSRRMSTLLEWGVEGVHGSPNHLLALVGDLPPQRQKLAVCYCVGGPAGKSLLQRLGKFFDIVWYRLGATEVGNICGNEIRDTDSLPEKVSVGPAAPGAIVQVVSENGTIMPAGVEGIVRIRTQSQVPGYIGAPEETARVFRDGWFHSGDLGYLSDKGELYITGRVRDQLNLGGVKVNPQLVDDIIQAQAGIREGVCLALPSAKGIDRLVAAIVLAEGAEPAPVARALRLRLEQAFGPSRTPTEFYLVGSIAKNQNGKIMRRQMVEVLNGRQPLAL